MSEINKNGNTTAGNVARGMGSTILAMTEAMGDQVASGIKRRVRLPEPITDGFGTFTEKFLYLSGCIISSEMVKGVTEISFKTAHKDGSRGTVAIGATPKEWDPKLGGTQISDAGEPGDYLLVASKKAANGSESLQFRYLDQADIEGARVEVGQETTLGENHDRMRQIPIAGQVTEVAGFVA